MDTCIFSVAAHTLKAWRSTCDRRTTTLSCSCIGWLWVCPPPLDVHILRVWCIFPRRRINNEALLLTAVQASEILYVLTEDVCLWVYAYV